MGELLQKKGWLNWDLSLPTPIQENKRSLQGLVGIASSVSSLSGWSVRKMVVGHTPVASTRMAMRAFKFGKRRLSFIGSLMSFSSDQYRKVSSLITFAATEVAAIRRIWSPSPTGKISCAVALSRHGMHQKRIAFAVTPLAAGISAYQSGADTVDNASETGFLISI